MAMGCVHEARPILRGTEYGAVPRRVRQRHPFAPPPGVAVGL